MVPLEVVVSLAPEFAPEVFIPERARRSAQPVARPARRGAGASAPGGRGAVALLVASPQPGAPGRATSLAGPASRPHRVGVGAPARRRAAGPAPAPAVPSTQWSQPRRVAVPREPVTLILRRAQGLPAERPAALPARGLRLTHRGVLARAAAVALLALAIIGAAWLSAPSSSSSSGGAPQMPATVAVQPGDTLWSLAVQLAPEQDPREVVSDLRRINGLDSVALQPGQVLRTR